MSSEPKCNPHPDAPHGFDRNASHNEDRYVCTCESWEPIVDRMQVVKDIINLLLIQHEAAAGRHNYFLVAANLIQAEFGEKNDY